MFKLKGRFLGQVSTTKKGGFIRKFLCGDNVYMAWSKDRAVLEQSGEIELPVEIQELVFVK